ncbi:hypothetical protein MHK_003647 [Candidatus Magnetomorum sp. HK-1]|nr:hypothetical protein MHK_003647 [Candidatus Magnetomorum sp. HK-1]
MSKENHIDIVNFLSGDLTAKEHKKAEKHLAHCDICLENISKAAILLQDDELNNWERLSEKESLLAYKSLDMAPEKNVMNDTSGKQIIEDFSQKVHQNALRFYQWVTYTFTPPHIGLQPAYAKIRSDEESSEKITQTPFVQLSKNLSDIELQIIIKKIATNQISIKVIQLNDKDHNFRITLRADGQIIASYKYAGSDFPEINDLAFGIYRLTITQKRREIGNFLFEINEDGLYEK